MGLKNRFNFGTKSEILDGGYGIKVAPRCMLDIVGTVLRKLHSSAIVAVVTTAREPNVFDLVSLKTKHLVEF